MWGAVGRSTDAGSRGGSGTLEVRDAAELHYTYQDGAPVHEAPFAALLPDGTERQGTLDKEGQALLEDVPPGVLRVRYGEDARPWQPRETEETPDRPNPHFRSETFDPSLLGGGPMLASAGSDEASLRAAAGSRLTDAPPEDEGLLDWIWGLLLGDFEEDPSTGEIVAGAAITMIPVVDQIADVRDIVANLYKLSSEDGRRDEWTWLALVATLVGLVPVFGSALKGVFKLILGSLRRGGGVTREVLFAVLRRLGRGDPQQFVDAHLDVGALTREAREGFAWVMGKAKSFFETVEGSSLVSNRASRGAAHILGQLREVERLAGRKIESGIRRFKSELDETLERGTSDTFEEGTTGGRLTRQTNEARPPDFDENRLYAKRPPPGELDPGAVKAKYTHATPPAPRIPDGWDEAYDLSTKEQKEALKSFAETPEPDVLPGGTKIYRVVGKNSDPGGNYWSLEPPPFTEAEWRAGSAVKNSWNEDGAYVEHTVGPDGLKVWRGKAGPQRLEENHSYILPGGDEQVWMPRGTVPRPSLSPKPTPWNPNF